MMYPTLTADAASQLLNLKREGTAPERFEKVFWAGRGERLPMGVIEQVVAKVQKIKGNYPASLASKSQRGFDFETEAGELLRDCLDLPPEVVADDGFWRYLAIVHFYDVVVWRHPPGAEGGHTKDANFGIGSKWENLIKRMWYRFEVAREEDAKDPYALCRLGDQDLWRSHILRVRFGAARHAVKALLKYQFPDPKTGKPRLHPSKENGIRMLVKIVRRIHATVALEVMTVEEVMSLISNAAEPLELAK